MECLKSGCLIFLLMLGSATLFSFGKQEDSFQKEKGNIQPVEMPVNEPSRDIKAGGYQDIDRNSEYSRRAFSEAQKAWKGTASDWEKAIVVRAESQVVAGRNIRLTFEGLPGKKGAVVYFPLDDSPPSVSWIEE